MNKNKQRKGRDISAIPPARTGTHVNQFIAQRTGISRRAAVDEILSRKVRINGRTAVPTDMVQDGDSVTYKGKTLSSAERSHVLIALNKPVGYVTSRKTDETNAPTVMELLPKEYQDVKPVGRLDKDSEGLLLLTNDGDFLYRHTHPKFEIEKTYEIEFDQFVHDDVLKRWKKGIPLREGIAVADRIDHLTRKKIRVTLHQGMHRQLRRMAAECGHTVVALRRLKAGKYSLGNLETGKWKLLPHA